MPRLTLLAMLPFFFLSASCASKETPPAQPPPPQCPAGQYWDGQYCQQQAAVAPQPGTQAPPAQPDQGTQPQQEAPIPGVATGSTGPTATPVDASAAGAATTLLGPLGQQHAPAGAKPLGSAIAGQFQQGQSLEQQVQMSPGKCYTIVAAAPPPVQNVDVQVLPTIQIPGLASPVLAQDKTTAPTAIIGEKPNCVKWPLPVPGAVRVVLTVTAGQGVAAAQVYEK
jgi:hypothetical protein